MSVKTVKLTIDTTCDHDVDKTKEQLKKNQDALEWRIKNNCPSDQEVLFCVYDATTGTLVNPPPFDPCTSNPLGLKIGTAFTVKTKKKATLKCTGKDVGKYSKLVLTGTDVPAEGCPPNEPLIETHRLDVEIIP
jgi:hypothetical protein